MFSWGHRHLFRGDNLVALRSMPDGFVDLVATDPPFAKGREFVAREGSESDGLSFRDRWEWEDDEELRVLGLRWPDLVEFLRGVRRSHSEGLAAFLRFMAVRLVEVRRVLKPTGSLYLHCDPTASHYLKVVLDVIFGRENFRNEIIWMYRKWANGVRAFQRNHDVILFYSKTDGYFFRRLLGEMTDSMRVVRKRGYILRGGFAGTKRTLTVYDGSNPSAQAKIAEGDYDELYRIEPVDGPPLPDYWEFSPLRAQGRESVGYPTQKPVALYERMIEASTNEGDLVLDPFCGSGTTLVAAGRLNRRWLGADKSEGVFGLIVQRMAEEGLAWHGDAVLVRESDFV